MKRSIILHVGSRSLLVCWLFTVICECIYVYIFSHDRPCRRRRHVHQRHGGSEGTRSLRVQEAEAAFVLGLRIACRCVRPLISGCPYTTRIFPGCEAQNPKSLRKVDSIYSPKSVPEKATTQLPNSIRNFLFNSILQYIYIYKYYSLISVPLFFLFLPQNILE